MRDLMTLLRDQPIHDQSINWKQEMFALQSWVIFGLVIGALSRLVLTGSDRMRWLATLAFCVAGSVIGGFGAACSGIEVLSFSRAAFSFRCWALLC